ncbi:DNA-binding transcriptional regulator, MarR family [Amycolatopsis arida]|uniref:DNA-binding transcriptional regulator, MarR family n=1 Tax=Amycolatopsis arida TaxID=587909 RepID=A0A1I5T9B9_9PSEU|nr:MarR family transcriptional regulator [Amycolatopsis arida]TDX96174.1 DNA-binding MarR family transcriptional regulator [Amycolatopsis arida]SFP79640.1 DNA-binding transcriptional regulator, MarR family [Amycolatopsis arida]
MSSERAKLIEQVLSGGRELSTATVMFHTAIAERVGLSPVEMKTADYLERLGPLTPKELVEHSGLAPASVTALIDRLERKGFVRRRPHPADRRRVLVELAPRPVDESPWEFLIARLTDVCKRFSDDELRAIVQFLDLATRHTHDSAARITESPKEG